MNRDVCSDFIWSQGLWEEKREHLGLEGSTRDWEGAPGPRREHSGLKGSIRSWKEAFGPGRDAGTPGHSLRVPIRVSL